ncbi:MAG: DUF1178 family protein [Rhodobacteraceae bacterium]|jgi:hypothetical protein|nr:DUF1178 family protein [Paracoccaceae bacterium]
MIRYALRCTRDHGFDSWFQSAAAYDRLAAAGGVTCPYCGTTDVDKALMAPSVVTDPAPSAPPPSVPTAAGMPAAADAPALGTPSTDLERRLAALREKIERESEYVGLSFADEARAMHAGDAPERAIWGEARPEEARRLLEDGVPVAPLPFVPRRVTN